MDTKNNVATDCPRVDLTSPTAQYNSKASKILGAIRITIAAICLILVISLAVFSGLHLLLIAGIFWAGTLFVGILQLILVKKSQSRALIIITMVLSIVLSVSQAIMIAMFIQLQYVKFDHNKVEVIRNMVWTVSFLAFVEIILSIISSVLCCKVLCRGNTNVS